MAEYQVIPMRVWCEDCETHHDDTDDHDCAAVECGECGTVFKPDELTPYNYRDQSVCTHCECILDSDDYKAEASEAKAEQNHRDWCKP